MPHALWSPYVEQCHLFYQALWKWQMHLLTTAHLCCDRGLGTLLLGRVRDLGSMSTVVMKVAFEGFCRPERINSFPTWNRRCLWLLSVYRVDSTEMGVFLSWMSRTLCSVWLVLTWYILLYHSSTEVI